jgi:threonyl-tRNA synthetase
VWLAPIQVVVLPITDRQLDYARKVSDDLTGHGVRVQLDDRNEKIGYKIREWETQKVPYMLVIGEKEQHSGSVSVRRHRKGDLGSMAAEEFSAALLRDIQSKQTIQGDHP